MKNFQPEIFSFTYSATSRTSRGKFTLSTTNKIPLKDKVHTNCKYYQEEKCTFVQNNKNPQNIQSCNLFQTDLSNVKPLKLTCRCFDLKVLFGLKLVKPILIFTSSVVDYENENYP